MLFYQFLRSMERESWAVRLQLVILQKSRKNLSHFEAALPFTQVARIVYPLVFLAWAVACFVNTWIIYHDNIHIQKEMKTLC